MVVVVSGISSAIGIHVAQLLAEKGYFVRGFARRIDEVKEILIHPLVRLESADLNDREHMRKICTGADAVVHLAALSAPWGRDADFYRVNVVGTETLISVAKDMEIGRFIHISTPSLYFDFRDRFNIEEDEPLPERSVNAYAKTKLLAENVVTQSKIPYIILRPRAVFGPHDKTLFPRILHACKEKGVPRFTKKSPLIDITYVENVAHAIVLAIEASSGCFGRIYNITNNEPIELNDVLSELLSLLSISGKERYIPYPLAYCLAALSEIVSRRTGKEPILTRYGVGVLSYSQTLSIKRAQNELSYEPIISLKEGIERYVHWLQSQ